MLTITLRLLANATSWHSDAGPTPRDSAALSCGADYSSNISAIMRNDSQDVVYRVRRIAPASPSNSWLRNYWSGTSWIRRVKA